MVAAGKGGLGFRYTGEGHGIFQGIHRIAKAGQQGNLLQQAALGGLGGGWQYGLGGGYGYGLGSRGGYGMMPSRY